MKQNIFKKFIIAAAMTLSMGMTPSNADEPSIPPSADPEPNTETVLSRRATNITRTMQEVERYFGTFMLGDLANKEFKEWNPENKATAIARCKHFKDYLDDYQDMVEAAATAVEIPENLLACLLFVESKWDPKAKSEANALGLSQIMEETAFVEINSLINTRDLSASINRTLRNFEDFMNNRIQRAGTESEAKRLERELKIGQLKRGNELRLNQIQYAAKQRWNEYWNKRQKRIPSSFALAKLTSPEHSIIAGAVYLRYLFDLYGVGASDDNPLFYAAVGAYNIGPGRMRGFLKYAHIEGASDLVEDLERSNLDTVADYIKKIRRCREKDNDTIEGGNQCQDIW